MVERRSKSSMSWSSSRIVSTPTSGEAIESPSSTPTPGRSLRWLDLSGLLKPLARTGREDVLNGIAYDAARDRLFVTGKYWPKLFEIRVRQGPAR